MNTKQISEEQLSDFMKLIERKNIDLYAIKNYLIKNKLNNDISNLSIEEFNKLLGEINTPDIKVGDKVHYIDGYYTNNRLRSEKSRSLAGIVTGILKNERCTGNIILIGDKSLQYPESWINEGTPFVKKYLVRRSTEK